MSHADSAAAIDKAEHGATTDATSGRPDKKRSLDDGAAETGSGSSSAQVGVRSVRTALVSQVAARAKGEELPSSSSAGAAAEGTAAQMAGVRLLRAIQASRLVEAAPPAAIPEFPAYTCRLEGAEWPQLGSQPLFVRPIYLPCITGAMADLDPGCTARTRRFVVLGNGGTGKSALGVLVWRHALLQRPARPVIYLGSKTADAWVFRPNADGSDHDVTAFNRRDLHLRPELMDPRAVLICDDICPPQVQAFTVMISAPERDRWEDLFHAQPCTKLVMPPFSWAETQGMRDSCFPDVSDEELQRRFALVGGIPRMVFAFSERDAARELNLNGALAKLTLPLLANALLSPEVEEDEYTGRIMHMLPACLDPEQRHLLSPLQDDFYQPWQVALASRYVAGEVYKRLEVRSTAQLRDILGQAPLSLSGLLSNFFRSVYEPAALSRLSRGGKFLRLDVEAGTEDADWVLPEASQLTHVDSVAELGSKYASDSQQLLVPRSKGSFAAVDAVLPGGLMAMITVDVDRCDVNMQGLLPTAASLGLADTAPIDLHWVVPEERYQALKAEAAKHKAESTHAPSPLFALTLPEEQAVRAEGEKLARAVAEAESEQQAAAARQQLQQHNDRIASEGLGHTWAAVKSRVRHYIVCLPFQA